MSLLLTRTCEYAILVAVQQGRHFSHSANHDICIQSKLELRLPAAVDDLIPPTTIISTPPTSISRDGTVFFDTTLAYLISTKLLQRLRTHNAEINLTVNSVASDATQQRIGTLSLSVADAKMVVHHGGHMEKVNRFVVDRGDWRSLSPDNNRKEQLKAGLFIVSMPDKKSLSSTSSSCSTSFNNMEIKSLMDLSGTSSSNNTPLLFSDSITTTTATTTVLSSPSSQSFLKNTKHQQKQPTSALHRHKQIQQRQQKLKKSVEGPIIIPSIATTTTTTTAAAAGTTKTSTATSSSSSSGAGFNEGRSVSWIKPRDVEQQTKKELQQSLRRAKSHTDLKVDLNIDQLAAEFRRIQLPTNTVAAKQQRRLRQQTSNTAISMATTASVVSHPSTTTDSVPRYHQIGSGTTAFTFYFSIVHADNLKHLMPKPTSGRRGITRKPVFAYTFLSQRITCPASSISKQPSSPWPTCFYLRGHLVDIQNWLNDQSFMEVSLQLNDEENDHLLFTKETVGLAHIPFNNLAFYRSRDVCYDHRRRSSSTSSMVDPNLIERTFPVYDVKRRWRKKEDTKLGEEISKVTVRLGLVSGWWKDEGEEDHETIATTTTGGTATTASSSSSSASSLSKTTSKIHGSSPPSSSTSSTMKRQISHTNELFDWFKKKKLRSSVK
ncbi:hypothetical protein BDA99DRAFT_506407 [Phascolomyces articulosus]|uniref:Uncharacterized protein n=1 Tax=Phascolomyces articulosus TaxID=60185 RepID=A0AAD5PFB8_9FUNG|nr:hypothetical protein BDA99DRAFT_506407 [Phascolomyces articulosus]